VITNRPTQPRVSARWCLFGDTDAVAALERSLHQRGAGGSVAGAVRGLGDAGQRAVSQEAAKAAADLLEIDLADVVIGGLRVSARLRAAAQRSLVDGGATDVVIASYRFTGTHRPSVALLVDGVEVARIHFSVDLSVTIDGLAATVAHGELVALGGDRCTVAASLSLHGQRIAARSLDIPLAAVVTLRHPIPLLSDEERRTLIPPVGRAAG
jgi:hypothetical protein